MTASKTRARGLAHSVHRANNFAAEEFTTTGPPRRIFFIRHSQGEHNAAKEAGSTSTYLLEDAKLSARGEQQATTLAHAPAFQDDDGRSTMPELVLCSPLRRTMQTAMLGFGSATPCVLRPDLQETNLAPCDSARPELGEALLQAEGWHALLDAYRALPQGWHVKGGKAWRASVKERFKLFVEWLGTRPERSIAVVTHHDFLKANLGVSFATGEVRAYCLFGGKLVDGAGVAAATHMPAATPKARV